MPDLKQVIASLPLLPRLVRTGLTNQIVNDKQLTALPGDTGEYITISAEEGDGAADYYGEFSGGDPWVCPEIEKWAIDHGYTIEWENPGTLSVYVNV